MRSTVQTLSNFTIATGSSTIDRRRRIRSRRRSGTRAPRRNVLYRTPRISRPIPNASLSVGECWRHPPDRSRRDPVPGPRGRGVVRRALPSLFRGSTQRVYVTAVTANELVPRATVMSTGTSSGPPSAVTRRAVSGRRPSSPTHRRRTVPVSSPSLAARCRSRRMTVVTAAFAVAAAQYSQSRSIREAAAALSRRSLSTSVSPLILTT